MDNAVTAISNELIFYSFVPFKIKIPLGDSSGIFIRAHGEPGGLG